MRNIYIAMAMTIVIILSASCAKEDIGQLNGPFEISITGEMGGFDISTRSEVESVIRMKWNTTQDDNEKDVVWVYGYDGSSFKSMSTAGLKATSSAENPCTATLCGTIEEMPSDGYLYLIHCPSGTYSQPEVTSSGAITVDMSAVEQSASVTPFIIYSSVKVSATALDNLTAKFSFATSMIKVNITGLETSAALTKATLSNVNKNCSLSFSDGAVTVASAPACPALTDLGTFTKNLSCNATASGKATYMLAVPAMSAHSGRVLTVTGEATKPCCDNGVAPGAHPANSYVNTICCVKNILLPGKFSVDSSLNQVQFTKGNLYWDGSAYHFEVSQTAYPSSWSTSHVGHFFWSSQQYAPYSETYSGGLLFGGIEQFFCGEDNKITVDGQSGLYAMSSDQWDYLIRTREVNGGTGKDKSYQIATVNSVYGLILYPDGYRAQVTSTSYTSAEWTPMETAGCVFLPAAGYRDSANISDAGSSGHYWSSTLSADQLETEPNQFSFRLLDVNIASRCQKSKGMSVRLVCAAESGNFSI